MRDANLFEALPPVTIVSNTASATSAKRPYLQTFNASTPYAVGDAPLGVPTAFFAFKTVDSAGSPIAAVVEVSVSASVGNALTSGPASGTLLTPTVDALITAGVAATAFTSYTAQILTDSTTGIGGAEITFSAHATVMCTVRYGEQQVVTSVIV
jgi:hypothetical protein